MQFVKAKKQLSEFVHEIVTSTGPDKVNKTKFMTWLKDYQLNLRYNVGFMVQNRRLRRILGSGVRNIVPETDFPNLNLANNMLG